MNTLDCVSPSVKTELWNLCREFLGGPWAETSLMEVSLRELKLGLSNKMFRCSLLNAPETSPEHPAEVLVRMYGMKQDSAEVVAQEIVVFTILSERGLGPRLYGVFDGGRIEEYIPSRSLSADEMRLYSVEIARETAKVHSLKMPLKKSQDNWKNLMHKTLEEVKEILEDDHEGKFMSYDQYKNELEWIDQEIKKTMSPVVFSHNDIGGPNILYREDVSKDGSPVFMFIDYEFAMYNYRGFDIGMQFCEWCYEYLGKPPYFSFDSDKFPGRKEQEAFVNAYLDQLRMDGATFDHREEALKILDKEVPVFVCAANLLWSLYCIKLIPKRSADFCYEEYSKTRRRMYEQAKKSYFP